MAREINRGQFRIASNLTRTGTKYLKRTKMNSKNTKSRRKSSGLKEAVVPEDLQNKEIEFRMTHVKDNPDGSGDYKLHMNEYTQAKLVELGVIGLLKQAIAQQKKPWYKRWFNFKTNCTGNCDQGRKCDCK